MFVQSNLFEVEQSLPSLMGCQCHFYLQALENAVADNNESISARAGILLANISYKVIRDGELFGIYIFIIYE